MTTEPQSIRPAPLPPFYRRLRWFAVPVFRAWFGMRALNVDRVPPTGPVILASNHVAFTDPPMIGAVVERTVNCLARDTLFQKPGLGWLVRTLQAVPVDRQNGGAGLKAILDRLTAGGCVVLFPEGTRSPDGSLQRAKSGVGLTVIKSKAPVVPVRIFGAFEAYGRHRLLPRPGRITIKFGRPLLFAALRAEAETCSKPRLKAIYQEIADEIMDALAAMDASEEVSTFP